MEKGVEIPRLTTGLRLEVERVEDVDLLEGEYSGQSEHEVKCQDEDII